LLKGGSGLATGSLLQIFGKGIATLAILAMVSPAGLAGPPFQTDDPEPIDFRNYEFYSFASSDGTLRETDTLGPALEFNWGALPLGTEVFYHGPQGTAPPQTRPAMLVDVGGYYKFRDPGFQSLFCYGHTAIG
jgi:hypothetical protein